MSQAEKEVLKASGVRVLSEAVEMALLTTGSCERIRPSPLPRVNREKLDLSSDQIDLKRFIDVFPFLGTLLIDYADKNRRQEITAIDVLKALGSDQHLREVKKDFEMIGAGTEQIKKMLLADLLVAGQADNDGRKTVLAWPNKENTMLTFEVQPGQELKPSEWFAVHLGQKICRLDKATADEITEFQAGQKEVKKLILASRGKTIPAPIPLKK